jgi:hypothetical protein
VQLPPIFHTGPSVLYRAAFRAKAVVTGQYQSQDFRFEELWSQDFGFGELKDLDSGFEELWSQHFGFEELQSLAFRFEELKAKDFGFEELWAKFAFEELILPTWQSFHPYFV